MNHLTKVPEFAASAKELIFMGGMTGAGLSKATDNPDFGSDFNLLFDPEAAEIVLSASWPKITSVGDVTNETLLNDELIKRIAQQKTPLTEYNLGMTWPPPGRPVGQVWNDPSKAGVFKNVAL
jgi:inosine-uridine nucleoside N-ribohydrolase